MGLEEFFTIIMIYFRLYPQYFYPVKLFSISPGPTFQFSILPFRCNKQIAINKPLFSLYYKICETLNYAEIFCG